MATASDIVAAAAAEIGYTETPPNSNRSKYGAAYGLDGQPWCMMFCWWVLHKCGADFYKTASCSALRTYAKKHGMWVENGYRPGDIVIMTWNKNRTPQHCGIVESVDTYGYVHTIEGNTAVGNDDNGGKVMRRSRGQTCILGAVRPKYDAEIKQEGNSVKIELSVLCKGAKGEQVKTLQRLLTARGYSCGASGADGDFGENTKNAVKRFQSASGLSADGVVGENTWNKILKG